MTGKSQLLKWSNEKSEHVLLATVVETREAVNVHIYIAISFHLTRSQNFGGTSLTPQISTGRGAAGNIVRSPSRDIEHESCGHVNSANIALKVHTYTYPKPSVIALFSNQ